MRKNRARTFVKILMMGLFGLGMFGGYGRGNGFIGGIGEIFSDFGGLMGLSGFSIVQKVFAVTYAPGTRCPATGDDRLAVICGTVKGAMPKKETLYINNTTKDVIIAGKPLAGVSVYVYECDPTSATCKDNGKLVHPFSSTYTTDDDGKFRVTIRKLGGYKRRYLVYACAGKIANVTIVPSYKNLELVQYLDCPDTGSYVSPPNVLSYIDRKAVLSTDMIIEAEEQTLTMEVSYLPSTDNGSGTQTGDIDGDNISDAPKATLNFDLRLEDADARFVKEDNFLVDLANQEGADKGAFWHKDCLIRYADQPNVQQLCMEGDLKDTVIAPTTSMASFGPVEYSGSTGYINKDLLPQTTDINTATYSVSNKTIDEYENALYRHALYVVQTKLPNIPPKNSILFYKEFTPRQDLVEYIQNPVTPAQFLHTQFGNCIGDVLLRHYGESKSEDYISCEEIKKCNSTLGDKDDPYNFRNVLLANGPAKLLGDPYRDKKHYEEINDANIVCQTDDGEEVRIYEIQPGWDNSNGAKYRLNKRYWNSELIYYYGVLGSTAKYSLAFFSKNDSFGAAPMTENSKTFEVKEEAGGNPMRGGTSAVFTNGGKNSNNSMVTALAVSSSGVLSTGGSDVMTDVLASPYVDKLYPEANLAGARVLDKGISESHGLFSKTNKPDIKEVNQSNEKAMYRNNDFEGNNDHYPKADLIGTLKGIIIQKLVDSFLLDPWDIDLGKKLEEDPNRGTRTPTSALFFTTPARNRMYALAGMKGYANSSTLQNALGGSATSLAANLTGKDFYDGVLTASYGTGKVSLLDIARLGMDAINSFFERISGGKTKGKSFLDRENGDKLINPEVRDDMMVSFTLSEENFMDKFPLPTPEGPMNRIIESSNDLSHTRELEYWLDPEDWGQHVCYPWHYTEFAHSCNTYKEYLGISRTCRVDVCKKASVKLTWTCTATSGIQSIGTGGGQGKGIVVRSGPDIDVVLSNTHCDRKVPRDRIKCAGKQTSCLESDGGIKRGSRSESKGGSTAACLANDDEGIYWGEIEAAMNNPPECPGFDEVMGSEGQSVEVSRSVNTPACTLSKAGPFECKGNLAKDANFETIQQPLKETNAMGLDALSLADNKLIKEFAAPFSVQIATFVAAEVSAESSIKPSDGTVVTSGGTTGASSAPGTADYKQTAADDYHWGEDETAESTTSAKMERIQNETYGKDVLKAPGGGGKKFIMNTFAMPVNFGTPKYNEVYYHCNSELGGGNWDCNLWPVPNPEIVDINDLQVDGSCELKATPACIAAINNAGLGTLSSDFEFSDAFVKIVSAAGTRFGIPAASLVTYLTRIGSIYKYSYYWNRINEKSLIDNSAPWYGSIGDCDDMDAGAVGPYDMLLKWFIQGVQAEGGTALNEIAEGRGQILNDIEVVPSRCNFLDSSYIAAAMLTGGTGGGGCGSWDWNRTKAQLYTLAWGADRRGAYQQDQGLENLKTVFEACK